MAMTATPADLVDLITSEDAVAQYMDDPIVQRLAEDIPEGFPIDAASVDPEFFNTFAMIYMISGGEPDMSTTVADAVEALRRLVHRNHGRG